MFGVTNIHCGSVLFPTCHTDYVTRYESRITAHIICEVIEVPDSSSTRRIGRDRVEDDKWIVLADIVGVVVCRIRIVESTIGIRRHILHVLCPSNVFRLKEINDRGYVTWDRFKVVRCKPEEVAPYRRDVIGLTGVRHSVVCIEEDTMPGEDLEHR